ncbi:ChaN family lipoprotein [Sporomusa aerivorans]|uniref:ChaN family lipoprotein n=1 Tax=Sporomusa aerivorans TaxID=204936 RepID=UPI00352B512C
MATGRKLYILMTTLLKPLWLLSILFLLLSGSIAQASEPETVLLYDTVTGRQVSLVELGERLTGYDVLLFGEYHDDDRLHRLEAAVLAAACARNPQLAVSLEMFERDVQPELDRYLAGEIAETVFLDRSRPWNNYTVAYRPLVELAKEKGLGVIAANIPRSVAAQYAREGSLDGVSEAMRQYLPAVHRYPDGEYKQRFYTQLQALPAQNSGMKVAPERLEAFYRAQCLKDDAMAESIARYYRQNPGRKIVHYQGDFHSRSRLGVAEKLQALEPAVKILVIAPYYAADFTDLPAQARHLRADADIIAFLPPPGKQ